MSNFPTDRAVELLCEDATNPYGWLSDGIYETAEPDKENGIVTLENGDSIDLYALVDIVKQAIKENEGER